jgi:sec-independent protein translocase protein TatA
MSTFVEPICVPRASNIAGTHMESIGFPELLVILGIAVLLFGGSKIPEVAKGLGEGIRNFKKALKDEDQPKTS